MRTVRGQPWMIAWLARALGLDGNPLRRASDRAEAWVRAGLVAVFLIAGPMAALAAGGWVLHICAEISARSEHMHAVKAVVLQPAPASIGPLAAADQVSRVWVRARWHTADNSTRTGEVPAPAGSPAGGTVTVWLDSSGRVASPPEPDRFANDAVLAALVTLAAAALVLRGALGLTRRFLNQRRLAAWEAAWSAIGPR